MPVRIVDSVGWLAYFMGDPLTADYREYIQDQSDIITPTIIVYEVYKKMLSQISRRAAAMAIAQLNKTNLVPLDYTLAGTAARISIQHKLSMADAIIYATAVSSHATLITSDVHFQKLPDVIFIPR